MYKYIIKIQYVYDHIIKVNSFNEYNIAINMDMIIIL